MPPSPSFYDVLGIPNDATPEEIRRAYRELSRKSHPDVNPKPGATTQFLNIQEAYETLIDLERRKEYDQELVQQTSDPIACEIQYSLSKLPAIDEPQLLYAHINVSATPKYISQTNPTLNLCIVLDRSTSMQGTRLDTIKTAAMEVVRQTRQDDVLSVITFSDRAEILLPAGRNQDRDHADTEIRLLRAGGGTEIFQGLEAAHQQIQRYLNRSMVNHIILITDGHTYGDEASCFQLADECGEQGVRITALGIGTEWNDEFLDNLTNRSGGTAFYISNANDIRKLMQEKFARLNQVFAERVAFNLEPISGVSINAAFRLQPDACQLSIGDQIRVGSILKESSLAVILEMIIMPSQETEYRRWLARGEVSLILPLDPKSNYHVPIQLSRPVGEPDEDEAPSAEMMHALARITLYRMQERARRDAADGNIEEASLRLQRLATQLFSLGETELAHTTLMEADRIRNTRLLSAEGEKHIKYATRSLLLPARVLEGSNS